MKTKRYFGILVILYTTFVVQQSYASSVAQNFDNEFVRKLQDLEKRSLEVYLAACKERDELHCQVNTLTQQVDTLTKNAADHKLHRESLCQENDDLRKKLGVLHAELEARKTENSFLACQLCQQRQQIDTLEAYNTQFAEFREKCALLIAKMPELLRHLQEYRELSENMRRVHCPCCRKVLSIGIDDTDLGRRLVVTGWFNNVYCDQARSV